MACMFIKDTLKAKFIKPASLVAYEDGILSALRNDSAQPQSQETFQCPATRHCQSAAGFVCSIQACMYVVKQLWVGCCCLFMAMLVCALISKHRK